MFELPPSSFGRKIAASTTMIPRMPPPAFIGMPMPAPPPPRPGKLNPPPPPPWPRRSWMRLASVLRILVTAEGYAGTVAT